MLFLAAAISAVWFLLTSHVALYTQFLPLTLPAILRPSLPAPAVTFATGFSPLPSPISFSNTTIPLCSPTIGPTWKFAPQPANANEADKSVAALAIYVPQPQKSRRYRLFPEIDSFYLSLKYSVAAMIFFFLLDYGSRSITGQPMFEPLYWKPVNMRYKPFIYHDPRSPYVDPAVFPEIWTSISLPNGIFDQRYRKFVPSPYSTDIPRQIPSHGFIESVDSDDEEPEDDTNSAEKETLDCPDNVIGSPKTAPPPTDGTILTSSVNPADASSFSFKCDVSTMPPVEKHIQVTEKPKTNHAFCFSFPLQAEHNVFKAFEMPRSAHHFSFQFLPSSKANFTVHRSQPLQPPAADPSNTGGEDFGVATTVFHTQNLGNNTKVPDNSESTGDRPLNLALTLLCGQESEGRKEAEELVDAQGLSDDGCDPIPKVSQPDENQPNDDADDEVFDYVALKQAEMASQTLHSSVRSSSPDNNLDCHPPQLPVILLPESEDHEDLESTVSNIQDLGCETVNIALNSAFHYPGCEGPGDVNPNVDSQRLSGDGGAMDAIPSKQGAASAPSEPSVYEDLHSNAAIAEDVQDTLSTSPSSEEAIDDGDPPKEESLTAPASQIEAATEVEVHFTIAGKGKSREISCAADESSSLSDSLLSAAQLELNNRPHTSDSPNWALAPPDPPSSPESSSSTNGARHHGGPRNPGNPVGGYHSRKKNGRNRRR